jgi:hypothetical protein
MKSLALISFIFVIMFPSIAIAEDNALRGWPVPVDRPLVISNLNGFIETGHQSYVIHFNAKSVTAVFYDTSKKRTIVTFDGAVFYNRLRTNLLIADNIMNFSQITNLINSQIKIDQR